MRSVVIKLNSAGIRDILRSPAVQADLKARADKIASAANSASGFPDAFLSEVQVGRNRARARVWAATTEGVVAETRDRVLTRSIDAGR